MFHAYSAFEVHLQCHAYAAQHCTYVVEASLLQACMCIAPAVQCECIVEMTLHSHCTYVIVPTLQLHDTYTVLPHHHKCAPHLTPCNMPRSYPMCCTLAASLLLEICTDTWRVQQLIQRRLCCKPTTLNMVPPRL